jgi:predicted TIM-barrel fold metal-dependent hydrolase
MTPAQHTPPVCLAPKQTNPPQAFQSPPGSWDTHAHVIGDGSHPPFVAQRGYTPHHTTAEQFIHMMDIVGIAYGVLVQISVHGTDNSLILDGLRRYPTRLCGVGAIDGTESDDALNALREAGVRGVRINDLFSGGAGTGHLEAIAEKCRAMDWHLDLALHGQRLRELAPVLVNLDVPLVIDHMGWCPIAHGVDGADFQAVLALAHRDNCWVKLSAAYRLSNQPAPYGDVAPLVQALVKAAPTRTIWGSDWPHVALSDTKHLPEPGMLLDALHHHLAGDAQQLHAILVDNPRRLYGQPGPRPALI